MPKPLHAPPTLKSGGLSRWFTRFAGRAAHVAGTPWVFTIAVLGIVVWAALGPMLDFSEVWQLTVNTGTTIVTFLMVFLIQNTQNRDAVAMQIKLDELIRATRTAENAVLDLEELTEEELETFRQTYEKLAEKARSARQKKQTKTRSAA
ncbi:MAG: low affinity iron permease family protein [Ferrovibrio sp.]